ncbi:MAG: DUF3971 domain-containing protein [Aquamicrobium sp.]|uniref:YhdP family protein n=1 Tax=Aquamicrobium sp. TaxID=1872579 RepID=UPI00349E4EC7|nr:DUF3971 domain-containing protein [Aquamicrobium sp.]
MHSEVPPHEKIRFRRSDIASLDALPSAVPLPRHARVARASRKLGKAVVLGVLGICVAVALAVAVVVAGFGEGRLRLEAQKAVLGLVGDGYEVGIGSVGVTLDGFRGFVLRIDDMAIAPAGQEGRTTRVGSARFGLNMLPLLRGEMQIGRIAVSDAVLDAGAFPQPAGGAGLAIFNGDGLADPDLINAAVFDVVKQAIDVLEARGMRRIEISNVEIVLPGEAATRVRVDEAALRRRSGGGMRLSATMEALGRVLTARGDAALDSAGDRVASLDLRVDLADYAQPQKEDDAAAPRPAAERVGAAVLAFSGSQVADGGRLALSGRVERADFPVSRRDNIVADLDFVATSQSGTGKVEIERLRILSGRSTWGFHGAIGPAPREGAAGDGPPSENGAFYRYELVSDGSSVAPAGSSEPTLLVAARVAGRLDAAATALHADEIGVRSPQGEVTGHGAVRFERGKRPGLDLRIDVGAMPVSHAKQLWPWFAAGSAQRWVTANVFGGQVEGGWVELKVPAGRFGDGTPLRHEEVSGFFKVRGTRFDVAGRIPPVRDGTGTVAFFGTDVEIELAEGTVYMPSGRTVAASNGVLDIRDAHIKPTIGRLDIEVAGQADAVLELASYDPIGVGRFVDLKPDDLDGTVSGSVAADIPLQSGVPLDRLDWKVELAYDDLSVARPFQGQAVRAATGTIIVDPQKAVIEAKAQLNGLPATLKLTEPLGQSTEQRQRQIAIDMDDKARAALAPGLDALLSGIVRVEVDDAGSGAGSGAGADAARTIRADLQPATLSIPWVGWSKGAGVAAAVSFAMKASGGRTELSDFSLRGETFAASGTVLLNDGGVERVRFPAMRLNRGDDFSLDVVRSGGGYAVTVRGKSVDARSLVKLYTRDAGAGGTAEAAATPVTLDLKVDAMSGFHGEVLRDVTLSYSGTGAQGGNTEFSATTASGQQIVFRDGMEGGTRGISMQSADAGALLRFLDIYERMEGGRIALSLSGRGGETLRGRIDARDFWLVNEPRLSSIVSTPSTQDGRSLNQAVRGSLDTSRVQFERGYAEIARGQGRVSLDRGILRGPMIGVSFQGLLSDGNGNMAMTGTFMPAYGLNRIFGEIPIIGQILGNGRDRGLIGITFRLAGKTDEPRLEVNPLSVIAPGIFRSVFKFR